MELFRKEVVSMDVSKLFKGQKLTYECPNCNHKISFDASLAFKSSSSVTCPKCSTRINLDTSGNAKSIEKGLKDLQKKFK